MAHSTESIRRGRVVGKWLGGYTRKDSNGRLTYYIEREVNGRRFHISTRCHDKEAARAHLARFEADPSDYRPEGQALVDQLRLTADLLADFGKWQKSKGVTARHRHYTGVYLAQWTADLKGADLRRIELQRLKEIIANRGVCTPHRIAALKVFCKWLRTEKGILRSDDDTTKDLMIPQSTPEKWRRRKVVEWARVQEVGAKLTGLNRDCLALLCATGWHLTELQRFAKSGELVPNLGPVLAVMVTLHKGGELTRTPLQHQSHVEAARRLKKAKAVPSRIRQHLAEACEGGQVFTLGVLRHSVATWAKEGGADPQQISEFLGHKDKRTTARFYIDMREPSAVVPVNVL